MRGRKPNCMTLLLTPDELRELTGHRRADAQARELEFLGIPFRTRRDGSLVVLRVDLVGNRLEPGAFEPELTPPEPEMMP